MTVERGEEWGTAGPLADDGVVVRSDAEARRTVAEARKARRDPPELGLAGGDLWRTCGGRDPERLRTPEARRVPVDLGVALVDGVLHPFTAHLVARRSWWFGPLLVVMNAQFLGDWDMAPRGHPNDGRLDVLETAMPFGERLKARGRLSTGTHVPHPQITQRRVAAAQFDLDPRTDVWLDGERVARGARGLSVRVEPDALLCVV